MLPALSFAVIRKVTLDPAFDVSIVARLTMGPVQLAIPESASLQVQLAVTTLLSAYTAPLAGVVTMMPGAVRSMSMPLAVAVLLTKPALFVQ